MKCYICGKELKQNEARLVATKGNRGQFRPICPNHPVEERKK